MPLKDRLPVLKGGGGKPLVKGLEPDSPSFDPGLAMGAFARSSSADHDKAVIAYVDGHLKGLRGRHPRLIQNAVALRDAAKLRVAVYTDGIDPSVAEKKAIEWLNVHGRRVNPLMVREVATLLEMSRGSLGKKSPEVKAPSSAPKRGDRAKKKRKRLSPEEAYRRRVGLLEAVEDATDRKRLQIHEGQGAVGRLDRLVLFSTGFRSCSPVLMFNNSTKLGGLYHFSAGHVDTQAKEMRGMLHHVQPDEIHIFSGSDGELGAFMAMGGGGASAERRLLTEFFDEEGSAGNHSASITAHKDMFSQINLTWGDGEATWAKKMTASGKIDLESYKHAPPKGLEFEAFTSKDIYYGI